MPRVRIVRRHYLHWGKFSGYHRFAAYLNEPISTEIRAVPIGNDLFPIKNAAIRRWVLNRAKGGLEWYELNDLMEEMRAVGEALCAPQDVLHYLDGDHCPQYVPRVVRRVKGPKGRPKVIASFHQTPDILAGILSAKTLVRFDRVVLVSRVQTEIFSRYVDPSRIRVLPHGVDTDFFSPSRGAEHAHARFRCVTVGSWLRDFDVLWRTAEILREKTAFEFVVISPTPVQSPGLPHVRILSGLDDEALRQSYRQANVLFLPLKGSTANNALLEGMACGLPVVTSDLEALREYAPAQAIFVKRNDPARFAAALAALELDASLRERLAAASRERAMELSWRRVVPSYQALYEEVCAE